MNLPVGFANAAAFEHLVAAYAVTCSSRGSARPHTARTVGGSGTRCFSKTSGSCFLDRPEVFRAVEPHLRPRDIRNA